MISMNINENRVAIYGNIIAVGSRYLIKTTIDNGSTKFTVFAFGLAPEGVAQSYFGGEPLVLTGIDSDKLEDALAKTFEMMENQKGPEE